MSMENITQETCKWLIRSCEQYAKLQAKTNLELAELVEKYIWPDINLTDPKSNLISIVIDRLRNSHSGT